MSEEVAEVSEITCLRDWESDIRFDGKTYVLKASLLELDEL